MVYIAHGDRRKSTESDTPTHETRHNDREDFSNPYTSGVNHLYGDMPWAYQSESRRSNSILLACMFCCILLKDRSKATTNILPSMAIPWFHMPHSPSERWESWIQPITSFICESWRRLKPQLWCDLMSTRCTPRLSLTCQITISFWMFQLLMSGSGYFLSMTCELESSNPATIHFCS